MQERFNKGLLNQKTVTHIWVTVFWRRGVQALEVGEGVPFSLGCHKRYWLINFLKELPPLYDFISFSLCIASARVVNFSECSSLHGPRF